MSGQRSVSIPEWRGQPMRCARCKGQDYNLYVPMYEVYRVSGADESLIDGQRIRSVRPRRQCRLCGGRRFQPVQEEEQE